MRTCGTCGKDFDGGITTCPDDGTALDAIETRPATDELAPGTMVGDYRIEARIGAGAYGVVYAAEHPLIGKRAAIKVLARKYCADTTVVSRFITEARAVNRIRHPGIVDVFAFGQHGEQHFLAMELLDGTSLGELLDERERLPPGEAIPILRGIAEALDAAHRAGVIHRDLKPDNVFLTRGADGAWVPKLLDFGVAKLGGDGAATHKTRTGTTIGTPLYMSPEQCRGKALTGASDVYALGAVTYQVLTGRLPFDGESVADVLMGHIGDPVPPLSEVLPALGPRFDAAVTAMLAKKPEDRPASAVLAIRHLSDACDGPDAAASAAVPMTPADVPGVPTLAGGDAPTTAASSKLAAEVPRTLFSSELARGAAPEVATPGAPARPAEETLASPGVVPSLIRGGDAGARRAPAERSETMSAVAAAAEPAAPGRRPALGVGLAVAIVASAAVLVWRLLPQSTVDARPAAAGERPAIVEAQAPAPPGREAAPAAEPAASLAPAPSPPPEASARIGPSPSVRADPPRARPSSPAPVSSGPRRGVLDHRE